MLHITEKPTVTVSDGFFLNTTQESFNDVNKYMYLLCVMMMDMFVLYYTNTPSLIFIILPYWNNSNLGW